MKKTHIIFLILTLMVSFFALSNSKKIQKLLVVVNENVILENELDNMIKTIKQSTPASNLPDSNTLKKQVLDKLIVETLIIQKALQNKIVVTDDELESVIKKIINENSLTIDEFRANLTKTGISFEEYKERIKNELLIDKVRMKIVMPRVNVTEKEVTQLANEINNNNKKFDEINLSHILIAVPEKITSKNLKELTEQVNTIFLRLKAGESFAKLAGQYSNDDSALNGGEIGWHNKNSLPTLFEENLANAKKNDLVGPLRSGVGFHILKVNDIKNTKNNIIKEKELKLSHILLKSNILTNDNQLKNKLTYIYNSIISKKETFEVAAKSYSEDIGSASNGGDLGWNNPDIYDPAFKEAALKLKKGQVSKPIKSQFGWHLIKLIDVREVDKTEEMQKDQAFRMIFNRKFSDEFQSWINELRGDAYIEYIKE